MIKKQFPYVNNPGNQSDGVLKDVADLYGKSLRVSDAHSVVDRRWDFCVPEYDLNDRPTRVKYYHGTEARRTTFTLGMADTLSGKYFKIYTAPDNHLYTFWFNLDGGSTQPVVANTHTYVEIGVVTGDSPALVGLALKLAIEGLYSNYFYCLLDDSFVQIEIITSQMGENNASDSGTTGFPFSQIAGAQELIQDIEIEYNGEDPLFQGQELTGYIYNIYSGKFEIYAATEATLSSIDGKLNNDYGDSAGAIRTASQIGNVNGAADFGIGGITPQTLRVASNTLASDPNGIITTNKESGVVLSNSTTTPLIAGGVFTGAWVDASQYSCISWTINSDVNSAANGLSLQFSADGVNIIRQSAVAFTGSANGVFFSFPVHAKYFRIVYTNGAVAQTRFILDVQLHEEYNGLAAIPLDVALSDKSSATAVKAVIAGKSVDGAYQNQRASGVSTLNSTATPLGAGATFTGAFEDVVGFANIAITTYSNVDSTTDGLIAEFSTDGVNVDHSDYYTVPAGQGNQFTFGVSARYFRIRYINGGTAQATFRLGTLYNLSDIKASSIRIDDDITGQNDAELVKAVSTGKNPNGVFTNVRVQGIDSSNSTTTPLHANAVYRGNWVRWSDDYTSVVSIFKADVAGTLYLEASQEEFPVDGSDVSVSFLLELPYDPNVNPVIRRNSPLQSRWARHRYVNGPAAQSSMNLTAILVTTDPGDTYAEASFIPTHSTFVGAHRSISTIVNADASGYQDIPVDAITGNPKNTINNIRDDILLKPLSSAAVDQIVVGTTPVRLDTTAILSRRSTMISNDGTTNCAVGFSSSITYNAGSMVIPAGSVRILPFSNSVEYWGVAENLGGVQTPLTRSGTTTGGTATGTGNTLASDNVYANITAAAQTATVTGFTAGTANPLVSVKLGVEGKKQSGQFETVTFVDAVTGTAANVGTLVSASVTANILHKYLVAVSWRNDAATITGVTGMGATWTLVQGATVAGQDSQTAVYINDTTPTISEPITVTFSATATGSVIAVSRFSGVNLSSPVSNSEVLTQNPASSSYTDSINGNIKGMLVTAVGLKERTHTAGSGATEQVEIHQSTDAGLAINTLALASTATHSYSGTLSGNSKWSLVALTLAPADAINPRITLSYELSAVPGATNGTVVFSSTTDASSTVNITGDRAWVVADIVNIKIIATGSIISAASADIDYLYLELVDTTGNTTRLSVVQGGEAVI